MTVKFLLFLMLITGSSEAQESALRSAAVAFQAGDMPTAIRFYRDFLKEHPAAAEIRSNLGAALVRNGDLAEGIAEYQQALQKMPQNRQVRMNLALAHYKLGRLPDAIGILQPLYDKDPIDQKAGLLLAECLMQAGQTDKALSVLQPLAEEYPSDHAITYLNGMALLRLGRSSDAQAELDRILKDGETAEASYLMAQTEQSRNNLIPALEHAAKAVQLNPQLPGVHSLYAQILYSTGKQEESAAEYKEELKINAYDFAANTEVAAALRQDGKYDEALTHVARALQTRPVDPGALFQRAGIHLLKGDSTQAQTELESLVKEHPLFAEAHASLAKVYYKQKRTADGDRERDAARKAQEDTAKQLDQMRNSPRKN